jgi:hypothetical protein
MKICSHRQSPDYKSKSDFFTNAVRFDPKMLPDPDSYFLSKPESDPTDPDLVLVLSLTSTETADYMPVYLMNYV